MAQTPPGGTGAQTRSLSSLTHYAGAAVSFGLVVGIGIWGYGVLSRDAGGVPVVSAAADGPMRVAPETPGGVTAAHQGLSVNEVMAQGGAEKPADRLVLAPAPVSLLEEDQPLAGALAPSVVVAAPSVALLPEEGSIEEEPVSAQISSVRALVEKLAEGEAPLLMPDATEAAVSPVVPSEEAAPQEDVTEQDLELAALTTPATEAAAQAQPVVMRSLRPQLRPKRANASRARAPVVAAAIEAALVDVASERLPVGTRLVQLGAYDSAEVAQREWTRLSKRFEAYFEGKSPVVQRAESGGRVFFRLRAQGFADLADSRRFCAALLAERADCISVASK